MRWGPTMITCLIFGWRDTKPGRIEQVVARWIFWVYKLSNCIFVGIDGWARLPVVKNLMNNCVLVIFWTLETSCLMNVSFFHISVYTVIEQLRIRGSSRVVIVIGWCMLDHCNSCVVLNSPCELLSTEWLGIRGSSQVFPSVSWSPEPSGSCFQSFSSTSYRKACCPR